MWSRNESMLEASKKIQRFGQWFISYALFWEVNEMSGKAVHFRTFPCQPKRLKTIILSKAFVLLTKWEKLGAEPLLAL